MEFLKASRTLRHYGVREHLPRRADGTFSFRCPACSHYVKLGVTPGHVRQYTPAMHEIICTDCQGEGFKTTRYRSGIPARTFHVYPHDVMHANRENGGKHFRTGTPDDFFSRVQQTAKGERHTYQTDDGIYWLPFIARLPGGRWLAGYYEDGTDTTVTERGSMHDDEADAWRDARDQAERAAMQRDEDDRNGDYARSEGRDAGYNGKPATDNPYRADDWLAELWAEGHEEGREKREDVERHRCPMCKGTGRVSDDIPCSTH